MMKLKALSLVSGAGAATLLFLAACQQSETPVQPPTSDSGIPAAVAPESESMRSTGPGREPTAEELARFMEIRKELPTVHPRTASTSLAKAAALATCRVDFNNSIRLGDIPNQANQGNAAYPFYMQTCNTSYTVASDPINGLNTSYRLIPEASDWCAGAVPYIGHRSGAYCTGHSEGKYWPRRLGNNGGATGISFNVYNSMYYRDFQVKSLYVHSGSVEVWVYQPSGVWLAFYGLTAGTNWIFPAGTTAAQLQLFSSGRNGYFLADNLDIAIIP
jgi:hypothetical protein